MRDGDGMSGAYEGQHDGGAGRDTPGGIGEGAALFLRVAAAPDRFRPAITGPYGTLTYAALCDRARELATLLAGSRRPVLVYGEKEPAMVVAFLASLSVNRPYVPADPSMPPARVERLLDITDPSDVIAVAELPSSIAACLARRAIAVTGIDALGHRNTASGLHLPNPQLSPSCPPNSVAYVMMTSGTTGQPKGVPITYRALRQFTSWLCAFGEFRTGAETFLNQAPFNFDLSVMDVYAALLTGGTLSCLTPGEIADPRRLFARLAETGATVWVSTPSFARLCLSEERFDWTMLPTLRRFLFCGEVLPTTVVRELWRRFPGSTIWNTYGPTEATVAVTAVRVTEAMVEQERPLPVGWPPHGTDVWIADRDDPDRALPAGTVGEILIAGPQVSPGYLTASSQAPNSMADRFVRLADGRRAYRTGDLGRIDPADGLLYCAGRLDRQIKLHGYRLELEEIEAHLRAIPGVAEAAILVRERDGRPDHLMAFVVASSSPGGEPLPRDAVALTGLVRSALAEHVPSYALPRTVRLVPSLPLTRNGKLDRGALLAALR